MTRYWLNFYFVKSGTQSSCQEPNLRIQFHALDALTIFYEYSIPCDLSIAAQLNGLSEAYEEPTLRLR